MITPLGLGAIVASVPHKSRPLAIELIEILTSCASLALPITIPGIRESRSATIQVALITIDYVESRATARMAKRLPLRAWRAGLMLRAMIACGRPVTHDRGGWLCDDDTGGDPQAWPIGPREASNDNGRAIVPVRARLGMPRPMPRANERRKQQ